MIKQLSLFIRDREMVKMQEGNEEEKYMKKSKERRDGRER